MRGMMGLALAGLLAAGCGGASSPMDGADLGTGDARDVAASDDGMQGNDGYREAAPTDFVTGDGVAGDVAPDVATDAEPADPGTHVDAVADAMDVQHADTATPDPSPDLATDAESPDPGTCQPDCTDRQCGDDGCGGDCGTCGASEKCQDHQCWAWYCFIGCLAAADCAIPPVDGAYSADNYACESGGCQYLGCKTDAECQAMGGAYANGKCRDWGTGGRYCAVGCSTSADCASPPENGPYSADNYACDSGACRYAGCKSDTECRALGGSYATAKCVNQDPWDALCQIGCATAADCASSDDGPYSAANYACESGACRYLGCRSDAECRELGGSYASAVCL